MNKSILMGRLTADPELKQTANGISVLSFSIAVDEYYNGNKKTTFINLVAWRQTAEFISRNFTKGQMIALEGSIQTRSYEDRNGDKRTAFEVVVDQAHFCGSKNENQQQQSRPTEPPKFEEPPQNGEIDNFDGFEEISDNSDGLPF